MNTKFHLLTIDKVVKETSDTVSISFTIPADVKDDFHFKAGQYLTLKTTINNEDIRRSYSISSAPHEGTVTVAIKKVENGTFSAYAQNLKAGDQIEVLAPQGNFVLKSDGTKNYAFFAAGSGITPIISIIKNILNANNGSTATLFYGNKSGIETIYKNELDALASANNNFDLHYVLTREEGANDVLSGRINKAKIEAIDKAYLADKNIDDIYSCGPESIIQAVNDYFVGKGKDSKNIHFELFTTPVKEVTGAENSSDEPIPDVNASVTVIIDDEEFQFDLSSKGKNILQAAQDADADVPFSCKGGVCCTCRAKVIEGKAVMDLNYALEPEEVADGFILTCQAHPVTDKVVVSFDEY
ncbi:phenylacetic acid degradation protein [Putridiphycobacter roseus]|uniref:Phenylacetic acid degradation protein n=1 Tax=Putridiphycobacter roseus TaxID=2219161 RepID=A0A2W1N2L8_9FLAO|nr:FAD-binding oxidoreductase [Putridiphycobacter roseus]PZE17770.1 phenylacetic acid degradation protein [Putridiphycobacter roseus]